MATAINDVSPHVTPNWYALDGGTILVDTCSEEVPQHQKIHQRRAGEVIPERPPGAASITIVVPGKVVRGL
jgi:hypothetical protein